MIDLTIEARGFAPSAAAIALRTAGACPAMRYRPDFRVIAAIGLFIVNHSDGDCYTFQTATRHLQEGETTADLLAWAEQHLPGEGAIVSWSSWGSTPGRLAKLADRELHPRLSAAAQDTAGRWRDLPQSLTWHLRQARSWPVPCICGPELYSPDCTATAPVYLLPAEDVTAPELIAEAIAGWQAWARLFHDFDDDRHPSAQALKALDAWRRDSLPATSA